MAESFSKQLRMVNLKADVFAGCLTHALSTEKEEIMGLLLGQVDEEKGISNISSFLILRRSDKQADRVEISDEQLADAAMHAEQLSKKLQEPIRVVGWYHSHPHITVWPSHVDVRTQAMYQIIDPYFVGLIFSTFPNESKNIDELNPKCNEIQLTAFQSQGGNSDRQRREIPICIKKSALQLCNLEIMAQLPQILLDEEVLVSSDYDADDCEDDPLVALHNKAHKFNNMLHITSQIARPLYEAINARIETNERRLRKLEKEKVRLTELLKKISNSKS